MSRIDKDTVEASRRFQNGLDEDENATMLAAEREREEPVQTFPCADILWQGIFAQIGDTLKQRSWEIWMGTLCALGATAHKNLHWHYYRPLYGMVYGLLISPTGHGKGTCTDLCRVLLPEHYTVRRSVQSGPALFPILAHIEKDPKGKVLSITPRPAMLVIEEWTNLLKVSQIEFSNLQDTLNELFHTPWPFNVSRSDTEKSGGDRQVENPTLSICATTTASLLRTYVSEQMIRSGFLNRYLILPGSHGQWDFYDEEMAGINVSLVKGYLDHLVGYAWGSGRNVWRAYAPEAKERVVAWGRLTFNPLMQSSTLEAESLKRLHTYTHIIALLYAWSELSPMVERRHVEAAIYAITVSKTFVEGLLAEEETEIPKFKQYEISLQEKILQKVHREPGVTVRKVAQDLRKSGSCKDLIQTARLLASSGALVLKKEGRSELLYPPQN
jgi:hypothetical protein